MIVTIVACAITGLAVWAVCTAHTSRLMKSVEHDTIVRVVESYNKGLKRYIEGIIQMCPKCAHNEDGFVCGRADMYNFIKFGTCTNYEEKRF